MKFELKINNIDKSKIIISDIDVIKKEQAIALSLQTDAYNALEAIKLTDTNIRYE
jgi:hypothetical protein